MTDRDSKSKPQPDRRLADGWSQGLPPQNGDLGPYSGLDEQPGGEGSTQTHADDWGTASPARPQFIPPRRNRGDIPRPDDLGQSSDVLQTETEGRIRLRFFEFAFRRRKYKSRR